LFIAASGTFPLISTAGMVLSIERTLFDPSPQAIASKAGSPDAQCSEGIGSIKTIYW
jgi:hypothetical protein